MSRSIPASVLCVTAGAMLTGCASAPVQTASGMAGATGHAIYNTAGTGAHVIYTTGGDVYSGVGAAAKQPFRDFNMMQDPIPPVLLRAESTPYDLAGVSSCARLMNQVAELDLALGPDMDSPKDKGGGRLTKGADAAASAALEAATSAAEGFLPMRSIIKTVTGATRYERHVKHAVLAGTERRSFLKAIGMEHNCGWPAEPLGLDAAKVASVEAQWPTGAGGQPPVQFAAAPPLPPAAHNQAQTQTVAVASAVSPAHPNVQAIAVSTSTADGAPVTHVYMVANRAGRSARSVRMVTVANTGRAGARSAEIVKVSAPATSPSGAIVATAAVAPGAAQTITMTAPTAAQGLQVSAIVATSTVSVPNGASSPGVQIVSVTNAAAGPSPRTVVASSPVAPSGVQTLTVDDPLRNAAPSAQVAANGPAPAPAFIRRPARVVASSTAYRTDAGGAVTGDAFTSSQPAVASTPASAPWSSNSPGGR